MHTNELLVRTMNTAKQAREEGYSDTAEAFDQIVESLLGHLDSNLQPSGEFQTKPVAEVQYLNWKIETTLLAIGKFIFC